MRRPGAGVVFQRNSRINPDPERYVLVGDLLVPRVKGAATLQQVGPRQYIQAFAAATLSYQPPFDRAAKCRRVIINNVSAADNWQVLVGGREIMRFRVLTGDQNRIILGPSAAGAGKPNFFDWCRTALGVDPMFPVPLGLTLTVQSVGGATADIMFEVKEVTVDEGATIGLNHYMGTDFLIPITTYLNASQSAVGQVQDDTQVAPPWVPAINANLALPVNWSIDIWAIFLDGVSNNSFSGAANHVGFTQNVVILKNGTTILTRTPLSGGPSKKPVAAAAGSANISTVPLDVVLVPFENADVYDFNTLDDPITLRGGDVMQIFENLQGDLTGGEVFARALNVFIARVKVPAAISGQP